ncbi:MAG: polysaccharide deacetylase [Frankiales bacterium]|nr:polysaccharide deacetylase [Frankiales bacterium]
MVALLLSVSCAGGSTPGLRSTPSPTSTPTATATASAAPSLNPASVHADELGTVPVLMYHQVIATPKGAYDQTPAQFRAELVSLYRAGYRTITAGDLVSGRIGVAAGRSPMVLTFDDSTVSQYGELPGGGVDPRTAVGILLDVAGRYGEPHPVATFYVNAAPFAGKDRYLASLTRLGMELGDHTASHANLRLLDNAGVQRELAQGLAVITKAVPGARVTTMALPFGAHPHDRALAARGAGYRFAGVFLVGAGPARSPYSAGFDALDVPRIRSGLKSGDQAFTSTYWLPRLQKTRFISDGDADAISFPKAEAALLDPRLKARAHPY